ncbi:flagellar basal body-associated FliL family protein [Enemella evansiae]|uniref:hypothetical protein n=1 Tax=Enemella evansiae TaxID=2016499 RepID=UPI0011405A7A|nr:hypothetical protein [Enemella evansiae]
MKKAILIVGVVLALAAAGIGGLWFGKSLGGNAGAAPTPSAGGAPPATGGPAPAPSAPGPRSTGSCPTSDRVEPGTLTNPPETTWVEIAPPDPDRGGKALRVPQTKGGPLKTVDGVPQCFTPDPAGALTAAYYLWAMTDGSLAADTRRRALDTYLRDPNGADQGFAKTMLDGDQRILLTAVRFRVPIEPGSNRTVVETRFSYRGNIITTTSPMTWTGSTWKFSGTEIAPGERVDSGWIKWE